MQKIRIVLVLVIVMAAAVVGGGAFLYFRPQANAPAPKAPPPKPPPMVLAASQDLNIGRLITANDVVWSPLRNGTVLPSHMLRGKAEPAHVVGAVVRRAVFKGMPLTWSSIVRPGEHGFLAAALRPNHRAVTIMVDRATSQAALIYPGDHVDVILTVQVKEGDTRRTNTYTGTILENIRVVAVDRQVESSMANQGQPRAPSSRNASTVTLEVPPADAERLVLAKSKGSISLAMRSLTDGARRDERKPTAFENLLALPSDEPPEPEPAPSPAPSPAPAAAPPTAVQPEPQFVAPPPEPREVRVQVFRGSQRNEVLLKP